MILKNYVYFCLLLILFSCSQKEAEPAKSAAKSIYTFSFNSLNPAVNASIDSVQRVITATLPIGTDASKLKPTIIVSDKAVVSPASGVMQDFSKPLIYVVTAEDGTVQSYTVKITVNKSSAKQVKRFTFTTSSSVVTATIDSVKKRITAVFPTGTDLTKLTPTISVSDGASISPGSGVAQDFSKSVEYVVTAEDGSSQTFTATMRALSVISDQVAQGKLSATRNFVFKKALCKNEVLFGEMGYHFRLYDSDVACGPYVIPPISFFINKLEVGPFFGQGPYMYDAATGTSTSFFGCEVLITKITATTVEGKLKGGDPPRQYVEGTFTATLCK